MSVNDSLLNLINQCAIVDRHRLRNELRGVQRLTKGSDQHKLKFASLKERVLRSVAQSQQRWQSIPREIKIPPELPIAAKAEDIVKLLGQHQVIVVAGETGSGKTTQLPKLCLQAGLGKYGLIGHTQPRRLAAVSVANRIAQELGTAIGAGVGYQIRFNDSTSATTYLKLMTDGILLAEIQQDRYLNKYEVLIVDEAHERTLNIDFILGYLKQLLQRRPELKLVITSATIDIDKFSRHFNSAPVVTVSGRTFPVEIEYVPLEDLENTVADEDPLSEAILSSLNRIRQLDKSHSGPRDVLVFLSSEKEIRETALRIRKQNLPGIEVLPLYARLKQSEQLRIFQPHEGRRVILATNIAETSLTVPGIRYVIDSGLARISRYSVQSKIQRLPIEPISQASASQRAGRCGRVADGVCIRLYSEADFNSRPPFTDPEIQRTNLAAVILQMLALNLGEVEQFPFIEKPQGKAINDGYNLLYELGAVDEKQNLTNLGRDMSRLPVDPRFSRMLIAAGKYSCLREMLIIVSALSIQDPRETPAEKRQQSQEKHRQFAHPESDFLSLVNLWQDFEQRRQDLSQTQLRKHCNQNFLSFIRMREWRETHRQLVGLSAQLGLKTNTSAAHYRDIHTAFLLGSLNQVGCQFEGNEYLGSRNRKFRLMPGLSLARRPAKWIVSDLIIETAQNYSTAAAKIEPEWIESVASHLVKKTWSEPHWSRKLQQVMAYEKVTLYGLIVIEKRRVNYAVIDPGQCRELFIREALVEQQLDASPAFYTHNQNLIREVEKEEEKLRKQSYFLDYKQIERYYNERIPDSVYDRNTLLGWYPKQKRKDPNTLKMRLEDLIPDHATDSLKREFPDQAVVHNNPLPIAYQFNPGSSRDGATIEIPLALLGQLCQRDLDWAVPGQLKERCIFLLKNLPKAIRKNLIPLSGFVDQVLKSIQPSVESTRQGADLYAGRGELVDELISELRNLKGIAINRELLSDVELPEYLKVKINVVGEDGIQLGNGSDLGALKKKYAPGETESGESNPSSNNTRHALEQDGMTDWAITALPDQVEVGDKLKLIRYPSLIDRGETVSLRLVADKKEAQVNTRRGLIKLYMMRSQQQRNQMSKLFANKQRSWGLKLPPFLAGKERADEFVSAIYSHCFNTRDTVPTNKESFENLLYNNKAKLLVTAEEFTRLLDKLVEGYFSISKLLAAMQKNAPSYLSQDLGGQLDNLFSNDFLEQVDFNSLKEYPRYLQAIGYRLEKYREQPDRDLQNYELIHKQWVKLQTCLSGEGRSVNARVNEIDGLAPIRWLIEEYRVSLFAQPLKTRVPVSDKRLEKLWLKQSSNK